MYKSSHEFVVFSLDGSTEVQENLSEDGRAIAPSILDHCGASFNTPVQLHHPLGVCWKYTMPRTPNTQPKRRTKKVVVIPRPYCSPNPDGPNYEQYCCQLLMQHKTLWEVNQLKVGHVTFAEAYATFFQSGDIPRSLEADIFRLQQQYNNSRR